MDVSLLVRLYINFIDFSMIWGDIGERKSQHFWSGDSVFKFYTYFAISIKYFKYVLSLSFGDLEIISASV